MSNRGPGEGSDTTKRKVDVLFLGHCLVVHRPCLSHTETVQHFDLLHFVGSTAASYASIILSRRKSRVRRPWISCNVLDDAQQVLTRRRCLAVKTVDE
jgi:hypothetical protein